MLIDNFEQHFVHCVLNAQNAWKSAQNHTNSLNTSRYELMNILRDFQVSEYALWQKTKIRKYQKSTESFLNQ